MTRKQYDGYDYLDEQNLYTYPGSSVLVNLFDEQDEDALRGLEYRIVASQTLKLFMTPIEVLTVDDVLKIHWFLFHQIYAWAGHYRQVNISKSGKAFLPIQSFGAAESYLNRLLANYHGNCHKRQEVVVGLVEILDNLNYFHPFREGNGRTQREVIRTLALMKGYECEISLGTDDSIYHLYMDGTVYGDLEKLEQLIDFLLVECD